MCCQAPKPQTRRNKARTFLGGLGARETLRHDAAGHIGSLRVLAGIIGYGGHLGNTIRSYTDLEIQRPKASSEIPSEAAAAAEEARSSFRDVQTEVESITSSISWGPFLILLPWPTPKPYSNPNLHKVSRGCVHAS